jgi:hypothetical protein
MSNDSVIEETAKKLRRAKITVLKFMIRDLVNDRIVKYRINKGFPK